MPDWLLQIGGYLIVAGAAYGAIRTDLKAMGQGVAEAKASARGAHKRLDDHIDRAHVRPA